MPASTLADVASGALTAIGQLGAGQSMNAEDAALLLRLSNLLLSKSSTKRLMLFSVATRTYALIANQADYTIGQGGGATFADTRPTLIESAQINVPGSNVWLPISVWNKPQFDAIRNRGSKADIPDGIYVEYSFPNLAFHANPIPLATPSIKLGCWEALVQFVTILDAIAFPPAYEEFLESNLAVMAAPYYDQPVPQPLAQRAAMAEIAVNQYNAQTIGSALSDAQRGQSPNVGQPQQSQPTAAPSVPPGAPAQ